MPYPFPRRLNRLVLFFGLLLAACAAPPTPTQTPTGAPLPSATSLPPATQTALPTPRPSATPRPLTATPAASPTPPPRLLLLQDPPLFGEDVQAVQQRLWDLGYREVGRPLGLFNAQTDAAVRHFQYRSGLPVNGVLDPGAADILFSQGAAAYFPGWPFPGVSLAEGALTCDEHMLKDRLAELGFLQPGGEDWPQETIGAPTRKALGEFLRANGLEDDGVMDLADWDALYSPAVVDAQGQTLPPIPPEQAWQTSIYAVPGAPFDLAWDGRRLWVAASDAMYGIPSVYILDPSAPPHAALSAVRVGDCASLERPYVPYQLSNIQFAGGRIWALLTSSEDGAQSIQSIALESGLLSTPLPVGDCGAGCFASSALGFDGTRLWASANNMAYALNPATGAILSSQEIGWLAHGEMVFDGRDCMYVNGEAGVTAFSVRGAACASYDYGLLEGALAADGTRIWSASAVSMQLVSYDPSTRQYGEPYWIEGGSAALAFDGQHLWIAAGESLVGLDVQTGAASDPYPLEGEPTAMLYDGERLWVALRQGALQAVDPWQISIP